MKSSTRFLAVAFVLFAACGGSSATAPDGTGGNGGASNSDTGQPVGGNGGASGAPDADAGRAGASGSSGADAGKSADAKTSKLKTGDPCTSDDQCESMVRDDGVCMTDWPGGGYCTTGACVTTSRCVSQASCDEYQGTRRCLKMCTDSTSCRAGYTCTRQHVCVPAE
jgi:hypothetical protein